MPEGHTLHRLARAHHRWFNGHQVAVGSPQGRFADAAALLDGQRLTRAHAYGKHLFHTYDVGSTVHIHLGLGGKFFDHVVPPPAPRTTVRYRVVGPTHAIDLVGATVCELITPPEVDAIIGRLGPDPIRRGSDPSTALAALRRRTVPIGRALMDQAVLAGVGNVYRAEVLHTHGIHPETPCAAVSDEQWLAMWSTLQAWMRRAVREGHIITIDPAAHGLRRTDAAGERMTAVYRQQHCRDCGAPVRRWDLAGRWAYACESCQPPRR